MSTRNEQVAYESEILLLHSQIYKFNNICIYKDGACTPKYKYVTLDNVRCDFRGVVKRKMYAIIGENVCLYLLYRIVNYVFGIVMIFRVVVNEPT